MSDSAQAGRERRTMDLQIRPAEAADADQLSRLAQRAKAHWGYPPEWLQAWRAELTFTPEYLSRHITFVGVTASFPVGLCVLQRQGADASVEHLWIAPEYHGRGVGRALMARALDEAAAAGAARVEVLSDPHAEPFYLKIGARRVGEVPAPMPGAPQRTLPFLEFALPASGSFTGC